MRINHDLRGLVIRTQKGESIYIDSDEGLGCWDNSPIRISQIDNTLRILVFSTGQPLTAQVFEFTNSLEIVVSKAGVEGKSSIFTKKLTY